MAVAPETFVHGMRQLAAGVTVVTSAHRGQRAGLTATAVCSVSAAPPRLLVCINREAESHDLIATSRVFAVNVLASSQQALAEVFAGTAGIFGDQRFEHATWTTLETGAPVLLDCLTAFDCRVAEMVPAVTHSIFIGEVVALGRAGPEREPLVYVQGDYGLIAPLLGSPG